MVFRNRVLSVARWSMLAFFLLNMGTQCAEYHVSAFQSAPSIGASKFGRQGNAKFSKYSQFLFRPRVNEQCSVASSSPLFTRRVPSSTHRRQATKSSFIQKSPIAWPLYLSSVSPGDDVQLGKKRVLSFLRRLLFWPLRQFIVKPLKFLAEQVVDSLDKDETATVADSETTTPLQSTLTQTPDASPGTSIEIDGTETSVDTLQPLRKNVSKDSKTKTMRKTPKGDRWAVAASGVDLTGDWSLIVTDEFKREYDRYLEGLNQPFIVRSVAVGLLSMTTDECIQTDSGRSLLIRGRNVRGIWDRTLIASGTEVGVDDYTPLSVPIMSAESEQVQAESWWEDKGSVHVSWLRGVQLYGGGDFESRRYLEDDGQVYVCESIFHRQGADKDDDSVKVTWRFRRQPEPSSYVA